MTKRPDTDEFRDLMYSDGSAEKAAARDFPLIEAGDQMDAYMQGIQEDGRDTIRDFANLIAAVRVKRERLGMPRLSHGETAMVLLAFYGFGASHIYAREDRIYSRGGGDRLAPAASIHKSLQ